MAFSISNLLTPEHREYIARMNERIAELYRFDDLALGQELLKLASEARTLYPERLAKGDQGHGTYTTSLFWDVVPEIAKRLGVTVLGQTIREDVRNASDHELRNWVGQCIANAGWSPITGNHNIKDQPLCPWELLTHEACNGNPLAFAIDRIAPVVEFDRNDVLARSIREVSSVRGFEPPFLKWAPEMDVKPYPSEVARLEAVAEGQTPSFGM